MPKISAMQKAADAEHEQQELAVNTMDQGLKSRLQNMMDLNMILLKHEIENMENLLKRKNNTLPTPLRQDLQSAVDMWKNEEREFKKIQQRLTQM